jgi:hypothetical protein
MCMCLDYSICMTGLSRRARQRCVGMGYSFLTTTYYENNIHCCLIRIIGEFT